MQWADLLLARRSPWSGRGRKLLAGLVVKPRMSDRLRPSYLRTVFAAASLLIAFGLLGLWLASYHWQGTYRFGAVVPPAADAAPMVGRPGEWRYQRGVSFGGGAFQVLRMHVGVNEVQPAGWSADSGPYELARGPRVPATADFRHLG